MGNKIIEVFLNKIPNEVSPPFVKQGIRCWISPTRNNKKN